MIILSVELENICRALRRYSSERTAFPWLIGATTMLSGWWLLSVFAGSRWIPSPIHIATECFTSLYGNALIGAQSGDQSGALWPHVLATAERFIGGTLFGVVSALALAMNAMRMAWLRSVIEAIILPWQAIPPLLLVPIIVVIVGQSVSGQVLAVGAYALISFLPFALQALSHTQPVFLDLAKIAQAGEQWTMWRVRLPAALPRLREELKIVSAFCLGINIILEYVAAPDGLGRVMKFAMSYASVDLLLVCVVWSVLIGASVDWMVSTLLRHHTRWSELS